MIIVFALIAILDVGCIALMAMICQDASDQRKRLAEIERIIADNDEVLRRYKV